MHRIKVLKLKNKIYGQEQSFSNRSPPHPASTLQTYYRLFLIKILVQICAAQGPDRLTDILEVIKFIGHFTEETL